MENKDIDKIVIKIADKVRSEIKSLTLLKKSGKIELTIEINATQGAIGNVYIRNNAREKLSFI